MEPALLIFAIILAAFQCSVPFPHPTYYLSSRAISFSKIILSNVALTLYYQKGPTSGDFDENFESRARIAIVAIFT